MLVGMLEGALGHAGVMGAYDPSAQDLGAEAQSSSAS